MSNSQVPYVSEVLLVPVYVTQLTVYGVQLALKEQCHEMNIYFKILYLMTQSLERKNDGKGRCTCFVRKSLSLSLMSVKRCWLQSTVSSLLTATTSWDTPRDRTSMACSLKVVGMNTMTGKTKHARKTFHQKKNRTKHIKVFRIRAVFNSVPDSDWNCSCTFLLFLKFLSFYLNFFKNVRGSNTRYLGAGGKVQSTNALLK